MIGIKGQWLLKIMMEDKDLTIYPLDFDFLTIIEKIGNSLPEWEISFRGYDLDFSKYWNEGAELIISMGKTENTMIDSKFVVLVPRVDKISDSYVQYSASGLYNALPYLNTPHVRTIGPTNAASPLKSVTSPYFTWDDNNCVKTLDVQTYIQPNITDQKFVDHLANHAYLSNSYFGIGITSSGKFKAIDVRKSFSKDPPYYIGIQKSEEMKEAKFLPLISNPEYVSNTAIGNYLIGYGLNVPMTESATGARVTHQTKPNIMLTNSDKIPRNANVECKTHPTVRLTDNHHHNYYVSQSNNIMGLMNLSNECVDVLIECGFEPISIWDVVYLSDKGYNGTDTDGVLSGKYVVGLVSRKITGAGSHRFLTRLKLYRESINNIKGNIHS